MGYGPMLPGRPLDDNTENTGESAHENVSLDVEQQGSDRLIVTKPRRVSRGVALWVLLLFAFAVLSGNCPTLTNLIDQDRMLISRYPVILLSLLLMLIAAVAARKQLLLLFQTLMVGRVYVFDKTENEFTRNKVLLARFDEIDHLGVYENRGPKALGYRLAVVLKDGKEIRIDDDIVADELRYNASRINDFLKVGVQEDK